jgi:hypothetical protein
MKKLLLITFSMLCLLGCSRGVKEVDFVYYNLSGHQIFVTDVAGLPHWVSPGVLVPVSDDTNRLNEKSATSWEAVRIADELKIRWTEADKSEEVLLRRAELSLPTELRGGRLCFTYLGNQKWRVVLR